MTPYVVVRKTGRRWQAWCTINPGRFPICKGKDFGHVLAQATWHADHCIPAAQQGRRK